MFHAQETESNASLEILQGPQRLYIRHIYGRCDVQLGLSKGKHGTKS